MSSAVMRGHEFDATDLAVTRCLRWGFVGPPVLYHPFHRWGRGGFSGRGSIHIVRAQLLQPGDRLVQYLNGLMLDRVLELPFKLFPIHPVSADAHRHLMKLLFAARADIYIARHSPLRLSDVPVRLAVVFHGPQRSVPLQQVDAQPGAPLTLERYVSI